MINGDASVVERLTDTAISSFLLTVVVTRYVLHPQAVRREERIQPRHRLLLVAAPPARGGTAAAAAVDALAEGRLEQEVLVVAQPRPGHPPARFPSAPLLLLVGRQHLPPLLPKGRVSSRFLRRISVFFEVFFVIFILVFFVNDPQSG